MHAGPRPWKLLTDAKPSLAVPAADVDRFAGLAGVATIERPTGNGRPGFAPPACDACKDRRGRAFSAAWHGAWLSPENPLLSIPCFRSRIHPVHSRGVVIKDIDGLKSAVRPFGLNQPLITGTQCDVKKRSSRVRPHFNNVAGICDGQRARLWKLVERRSPHSLIEPRPTGRTGQYIVN